jgi:hypothetical protein
MWVGLLDLVCMIHTYVDGGMIGYVYGFIYNIFIHIEHSLYNIYVTSSISSTPPQSLCTSNVRKKGQEIKLTKGASDKHPTSSYRREGHSQSIDSTR